MKRSGKGSAVGPNRLKETKIEMQHQRNKPTLEASLQSGIFSVLYFEKYTSPDLH